MLHRDVRTGVLFRVAAVVAVICILAASAAFAVPADWMQTRISVSWKDANGEERSADAVPVIEDEGSFWVRVDADAPIDALGVSVSHPLHQYSILSVMTPDMQSPRQVSEGSAAEVSFRDSGTALDHANAVVLTLMDEDAAKGADPLVFSLFVSTASDMPVSVVPSEEQPGGQPEGPHEEQPGEQPEEPHEEQPGEQPEEPIEEQTEPPEEPAEEPTEKYTEAPAAPTKAPEKPAEAPVEPTEEPVKPTEEPVKPTKEPEKPTEAPKPPVDPTSAPIETQIPMGAMINRFGKTNIKNVIFRERPTMNSKKLQTIGGANNVVYLIRMEETEGDDPDDEPFWYRAVYNNKNGFVAAAYVEVMTQAESDEYIRKMEQKGATHPPVLRPEDIPEPTPVPTATPEITPTPVPTDTPVPSPTAEPTAVPTAVPTVVPTVVPTPVPTPTVAPTKEPPKHVGYAVTIGDGVYVRDWPSSSSVIIAELPKNKVVYVTGQQYQEGLGWHEAQFDNQWGYIRADMVRMMTPQEVLDYLNGKTTPAPTAIITVRPYTPTDLSSYGYVTSANVNFRKEANTTSSRIRQLKQYAYCLVLGSEVKSGVTWYKVSYNGQTGYILGDYFKQMTLAENQEFLTSSKYQQGIKNNTAGGDTSGGSSGGSEKQKSAEDQQVEKWKNPDSGAMVSYKPFDPFSTPEPLGTATPDAGGSGSGSGSGSGQAAPVESVTPEATDTTDPLATIPADYQTQEGGGGALPVVLVVIACVLVLGGGGYAYYMYRKNKMKAEQIAAQKRAAARKQAMPGAQDRRVQDQSSGRPVQTVRQVSKVKTGTYTGGQTGARPVSSVNSGRAPQSRGQSGHIENPYARYTTQDTEQENRYTANFKPDARRMDADRQTSADKGTEAVREDAYRPRTSEAQKSYGGDDGSDTRISGGADGQYGRRDNEERYNADSVTRTGGRRSRSHRYDDE